MRRSGLPPLRALQVFEAAARHENFSRAADELAITQSAVSRQVLQLEAELGQALFERSGPNLALTNTGRAYSDVVRDGLSLMRRGTSRLFDMRRSPNLTVTTVPSFASRWLLPRIADFEQRHPQWSIRIAANCDVVDFTADADIDVGIRYGKGDWGDLIVIPLVEEYLFPVCNPVSAERIRSIDDLCKERLLFEDTRFDQWREWANATETPIKLSVKDHFSDDFNIQLQAAMLGQGVALGRTMLVADDLRAGRLVCPIRLPVRSKIGYHVVCPRERIEEPAINAFIKFVTARAKESVADLGRYFQE